MRWLWMGFLILSIQIRFIGYSGLECALRIEANAETLDEYLFVPSSSKKIRDSPKERAISGALAQASVPEPLSDPRVPSSQPELRTPLPTSAPPAAPSPPPPVKPEESQKGQGFVINFDSADLYEVIRVLAEILKINYIVDPKVKGVVNIHTSGQILADNVFNIFQTILNLNGATAVKKENLYEIVPMGDAKKLAISPWAAQDQEKLLPEERYTIQIIALKYIPITEVSKMIKPFLSDGADIVEHPSHNILIVGDMASNVRKSVDIIRLFDLDIFSDLRVRIYPILNADATEIAEEMERIFSSLEVSTKSGRGVGITFKPIKRINSLLTVSSIPNIFEKVEGWLKELDKTPGEGTKVSVCVYYVQNAKAKDLADVLKEVFAKGVSKEKKEKGKAPEPTTPARVTRLTPTTPTPGPTATTVAREESEVPEGEISVVVDETTNALIIKAFQRDYKNILDTIKKLDIYPKQVLIEVYLAEITLDDTYKFGLEWAKFLSSNTRNAQGIVLGQQPPSDPFSEALSSGSFIRYSIVELGGRISVAVNAAAADNRLNVISSPHLLASNNKEAKIQIGKSQPILSNTYTTTSTGTATSVVEGTIEYKDIGIILTVTPRISDSGLVTLELQIEKSDVNTTSLGNLSSVPVFDKKTAKTVLSVLEGQTIVIGGLIETTKQRNKSGFPFLSKIPILGALFGVHDLQDKKTELILLMTPHIISDETRSKAVTEEFRHKIEGLQKEMIEKAREKSR